MFYLCCIAAYPVPPGIFISDPDRTSPRREASLLNLPGNHRFPGFFFVQDFFEDALRTSLARFHGPVPDEILLSLRIALISLTCKPGR